MRYNKPATRLSRRHAIKLCLIPATATATVMGPAWLLGCSSSETQEGETLDRMLTANSQESGTAGTFPSAGSTTTPGAAGEPNAGGTAGLGDGASAASEPNPNNPANSAAAGSTSSETTAGSAGTEAEPIAETEPAEAAADTEPTATPEEEELASSDPAATDAPAIEAGDDVPWASGGTASMGGNYPDPFAADPNSVACLLYPTQTLGPCYAAEPPTRQDISDGAPGLPVRLSFLVTRADGCTPVSDATVDIWHSGFNGVYSAFARGICNPQRLDVANEMYCRGVRPTDNAGRVDFDTIFPGWYTGRTIHIHFTVRVNGREAVTSQLYFEDALSDEILGQGEYASRGPRDTVNTRDRVFSSGGASPDQVLLSTAKRPDGVLHAWKVLAIAG